MDRKGKVRRGREARGQKGGGRAVRPSRGRCAEGSSSDGPILVSILVSREVV